MASWCSSRSLERKQREKSKFSSTTTFTQLPFQLFTRIFFSCITWSKSDLHSWIPQRNSFVWYLLFFLFINSFFFFMFIKKILFMVHTWRWSDVIPEDHYRMVGIKPGWLHTRQMPLPYVIITKSWFCRFLFLLMFSKEVSYMFIVLLLSLSYIQWCSSVSFSFLF